MSSNECFKCGRTGHWARECPTGMGRGRGMRSRGRGEYRGCALLFSAQQSSGCLLWAVSNQALADLSEEAENLIGNKNQGNLPLPKSLARGSESEANLSIQFVIDS